MYLFIDKMPSFRDVVTPSNASTSTSASDSTSDRLLGRVKWFNSKAGYGFITVTDGQRSGSDIFVHHSAVNVENQQYRYLVQGEYVEFTLVSTPNGNHEFQASSVCGIRSGKLMCETRREFKIARNNYRTSSTEPVSSNKDSSSSLEQVQMPRQQRPPRAGDRTNAPRARGNGPRDDDGKEWNLVSRKNDNSQQSRPNDNNRPRRGRPSKQQQRPQQETSTSA